jgi:hypothetical protein
MFAARCQSDAIDPFQTSRRFAQEAAQHSMRFPEIIATLRA